MRDLLKLRDRVLFSHIACFAVGAVALVSLPIAIWDDHAFINDRWGYGIVGGVLLVLIAVSVYKNKKALIGLF